MAIRDRRLRVSSGRLGPRRSATLHLTLRRYWFAFSCSVSVWQRRRGGRTRPRGIRAKGWRNETPCLRFRFCSLTFLTFPPTCQWKLRNTIQSKGRRNTPETRAHYFSPRWDGRFVDIRAINFLVGWRQRGLRFLLPNLFEDAYTKKRPKGTSGT